MDSVDRNYSHPASGQILDLPFKEAKRLLVEPFERRYIEELVHKHKFNISAASRDAQISRKHLRHLVDKYNLDPRRTGARDKPHTVPLPRSERTEH